ncbi:caspase family protein [Streptomyces sp. NPDC002920]
MTTVHDNCTDEPQVHAFIVGVGEYPYCVKPRPRDSDAKAVLRSVTPLTSAPLSARKFAEWLLNAPHPFNGHTLGSVEVLISAPHPVTLTNKGKTTVVSGATFNEVESSCLTWFRKCNSNPDNIALFFWCGHGWGWGGNARQELLTEDVGKDPDQAFMNVVDFLQTWIRMQACRAKTQCFFIDACRGLPSRLDKFTQNYSRALLNVTGKNSMEDGEKDRPILFSVSPGSASETPQNEPSVFTEALVKTLDGLGAEKNANGWQILTGSLGDKLRDVLAWNKKPGEYYPKVAVEGSQYGSSLLRTLEGPPVIDFRLSCSPRMALSQAQWTLHLESGDTKERPPKAADWVDKAAAGIHEVTVTFSDGMYQSRDRDRHYFRTPCFGWEYRCE